MRKFKFNFLESLLVLFGVLLFSVSTVIYFIDYPIRYLFFDFNENNSRTLFGHLENQTGGVKRQGVDATEFEKIERGSQLYEMDVLVVGSNTTATLKLEDGSTIDLAASTMVRLAFHNEISFGGIRKAVELNVVAGSVAVKTRKIKLVVKNQNHQYTIIPNTRQSLSVPKSEISKQAQVPVLSAAIQIEPSEIESEKELPVAIAPPPIVKVSPSPTPLILPVSAPLPSPSPSLLPLKARINQLKPKPSPSVRIAIKAAPLKAVQLLPLMVGGNLNLSNSLDRKLLSHFDIEVRWQKYPGAIDYKVWLSATADANKPLLEKIVKSNNCLFNKDKVYAGHFFYRVFARLKDGRMANSTVEKFSFKFLPPLLTIPKDNAEVILKAAGVSKDRILLTWKKTNFTQQYEIEISSDNQFRVISIKKTLKENYFILIAPKPGFYWWRVRGYTTELSSSFSAPFSFMIKNK